MNVCCCATLKLLWKLVLLLLPSFMTVAVVLAVDLILVDANTGHLPRLLTAHLGAPEAAEVRWPARGMYGHHVFSVVSLSLLPSRLALSSVSLSPSLPLPLPLSSVFLSFSRLSFSRLSLALALSLSLYLALVFLREACSRLCVGVYVRGRAR
jgi:hypothetical protein